nr:MAG TPA: hypothetical protein [Caudoviricetes sp.]
MIYGISSIFRGISFILKLAFKAAVRESHTSTQVVFGRPQSVSLPHCKAIIGRN